jgi:Lsr2
MNGAAVAQKVQTLFVDDLDGSAAEGTVRFGLDGAEYEIDLNAEHGPTATGGAGGLHEGWATG